MPNVSHIFEENTWALGLDVCPNKYPMPLTHILANILLFIFSPFFLPSLQDTISSDIELYLMAFYRTISGF
jgi:hypothetical protein